MAKGELQLYLAGEGSKDVFYESNLPQMLLGGDTHPTSYDVNFLLPFPPERTTDVLLEVGVTTWSLEPFRWKISFNNVVVTREFKPSICTYINGGAAYCKLVYNVKPIVDSRPSNPLSVSIRYAGVREIRLDHIGLFAVAEDADVKARYYYLSGALALSNGEVFSVKMPFRFSNARIHIIVSMPSPEALIVARAGGKIIELGKAVGMVEYQHTLGDITELALEATNVQSTLLVSSILVYEVEAPTPTVKIELEFIEGDEAKITIVNEGNGVAEKVIALSMALGSVLSRQVVGDLKPGTSKSLTVKIRPGTINTIRVIWSSRGKLEFKDLKIKPR
ncbi:hypothetical protein [Hyperthermus butylicus]|uniref:Uncharacterized protein n=1 Tax=Hyperthermus butylicus (strain DSM 5456 / JCM 9403 / PLM1-5) TaxID=415426 RepID=A2BM99_HYPBU|nr:hypothetical protein [Hyperthermus butylicus]ABM81110.1 hypothetical protein Hbut_1280 [Hyperthermus butylicus DSM 5456]